MRSADYALDPATGVWRRPGTADLKYSDGDEVEDRLRAALERCNDRSVLSAELPAHITDWPSEYHLSSARANLLRGTPFAPGERVLELGCGCGAITRALGEAGAKVLALEGSLRRAAVAASRCRDLPAVSVVHDTISDFRSETLFDTVTLIGVLEYAPIFFGGEDPVGRCLQQALTHLKPDGRLILAIENQLGLKYFAGCSEDHVGRPYFGIQGLYSRTTPVTFGRSELQRRLQSAGLRDVEWVYPFPDYKLPHVLLHDDALRMEGFNAGDLLIRLHSRDYSGQQYRAFDESLAWHPLAANGLIGDLANSFLVTAHRDARPPRPERWLAKAYNDRRAAYATETLLCSRGKHIEVRKKRLSTAVADPTEGIGLRLALRDEATPYEPGELLVTGMRRLLADDFDSDKAARWAAPWLEILQANVVGKNGEPPLLPGTFLDCLPFNLVSGPAGLKYIDAEWDWGSPIPLTWVLVRGLAYSASTGLRCERLAGLTHREFVEAVATRLGLTLTPADFETASELEDRLQEAALGRSVLRFRQYLDAQVGAYFPAFEHARRLPAALQNLAVAEQEVARVKSSLSWQITKPVRLMQTVLRGRRRAAP